jgi:hypothetical protein
MGDYVLTKQDVADGRRFYDCIGKNTFAAGAVHVANNNTLGVSKSGVANPPDGGTYDLPYRMLVPRKIEKFLVAGKHVSRRGRLTSASFREYGDGTGCRRRGGLCLKKGVTPRMLEAEEHIKELQTYCARRSHS